MISPFSLVCVENINPILSFYGVFVMKHFIYLNVAKEIHLKNSIALSLWNNFKGLSTPFLFKISLMFCLSPLL